MPSKRIKKQYAWYEWPKAIEESGKSVAELYDFKTGTLIDYEPEPTFLGPMKFKNQAQRILNAK